MTNECGIPRGAADDNGGVNPFVADEIPQGAQTLVLLGTVLGAIFSGLLVLFVAGEILSDPGGTQGILMVTAWLAAPALLSVLALLRPGAAYPILVVVVGLVLLVSLAAIPMTGAVWEFEELHGPINLLVIVGALIPLVAFGRAMPGRAGMLMLTLIVGFVAFQSISLLLVGQWSVILVFGILMPPYAAVAVLFVIAGVKARSVIYDT